jgi:nitroimidazol reductase NimA-like FMN-containing flavoprotein (pyridoxamine 5'-phosphate oxidase superfamily)
VTVELTEDELWEFLTNGHEGSLTTLRRDGWPITLPVWYVAHDRSVFMRTNPKTKKLLRIQADDRCSFLVSSGQRWAELKAVVLTCRAQAVDRGELRDEVLRLFDQKYQAFRTAKSDMPGSSQKRYGGEPVVVRLTVEGGPLSWDNHKLRIQDVHSAAPEDAVGAPAPGSPR